MWADGIVFTAGEKAPGDSRHELWLILMIASSEEGPRLVDEITAGGSQGGVAAA